MMRHLLPLGLLLAASAASAAERGFDVAPFERIALAGSPTVEVTTGRPFAVRAEGDADALDRLEVESRGGELSIRMKPGMGWRNGWGRGVTVRVSVPTLTGARVAGSGDLNVDRVAGRSFDGAVAGSGDLRLRAVDVGQARLAVSGSGDVYADGRCVDAQLQLSGSGDVHAGGLACRSVTAKLAGSGDIAARASGNADLSLAGSGGIRVVGGARCVQQKRGSGSISCG